MSTMWDKDSCNGKKSSRNVLHSEKQGKYPMNVLLLFCFECGDEMEGSVFVSFYYNYSERKATKWALFVQGLI